MKKKISLILLSIVQVVVNVMVMMNSTKEAKAFLSGLKESLVGMPEETIKQFTEVFTLDFAKSFITGSCGIIILVTLLFLVLVCFDKISKKKGFSIGLLIVTILLGFSDVGFLAAHKSGVPNKNIIDVNNEFAFNKFVGIDEFKKMIKNNQIILD